MIIEADPEVQELKTARSKTDAPATTVLAANSPDVDHRSSGRKDYDRIMYSHAFLRLAGVTQILPPDKSLPRLHNRLTHSLKVAQMARSVAQRVIVIARAEERVDYIRSLGGLDPDIAEAAGLAHDLGHPPFGHAGERQLDQLSFASVNRVIETHTGFEGNAQSFRIATKIEASHGSQFGLNLSAGTRAALLKYPWQRGPEGLSAKKFGYYLEDEGAFHEARGWLKDTGIDDNQQTLEASAMDLADDITYAVHDLEDFLSLGLIRSSTILFHCGNYIANDSFHANPIVDLESKLAKDYPDVFDRTHLLAACKGLIDQDLPHSQTRPLRLRAWRNNALDFFMSSIEILDAPRGDKGIRIDLTAEAWHQVELFKAIAKKYVIQRRETALMQRSGNAMLKRVLLELRKWTDDKPDDEDLPMRFQLAKEWIREVDGQIGRHYLDFICMLSDEELADLAAALTGQTLPQPLRWG